MVSEGGSATHMSRSPLSELPVIDLGGFEKHTDKRKLTPATGRDP